MKEDPGIIVVVGALLVLLITCSPALAGQGTEDVSLFFEKKVSLIDCLCCELRQAFYDMCQSVNPLIDEAVYAIAEHAKAREVIRSFNKWKQGRVGEFEAQVFFDTANRRLTIDVASHGAPGSLEEFKRYWERVRPTTLVSGQLKKLPRYKILHLLAVRKIRGFEFHEGITLGKKREGEIKTRLIERLKINIFFSSTIKEYLFREYSDGLWKRIGLSFF